MIYDNSEVLGGWGWRERETGTENEILFVFKTERMFSKGFDAISCTRSEAEVKRLNCWPAPGVIFSFFTFISIYFMLNVLLGHKVLFL